MTADRRDELVLSAIRAFAREGVPGATTRAIAAEAGVNIATLHYHFGGKDRLVAAVMAAVSRQQADIVRAAVPTDSGLEDGLALGLVKLWPYLLDTATLQLLQYELTTGALRLDDREAGAAMVQAQYDAYLSATREVVEEILAHSGQRLACSVDELATFVVTGLDGVTLMSLVDRDRAARQLELLTEAVIRLADPQPALRTVGTIRVPQPRAARRRTSA